MATTRPAIDNRELGRKAVGLLEVVGREQDGDPLVATQALDLLPHVRAHLRVEAGRGLVEEQHARARHERKRHVEPALHAAGEPAHDPVRRVAEAEALEQLVDAGVELAPRDPVEPSAELEVLARRRLTVGSSALCHDARQSPHLRGLGRHVVARHASAAGVGTRERRGDAHGGRLARAVRAEKTEDGALLDDE